MGIIRGDSSWGVSLGGAATDKAGMYGAAVTQPAHANQADVSAPAAFNNTDNEIGGLAFSNPPTQAEVEALRDKCEELADDCRALQATVAAIRVLLSQIRTDLITLKPIKGSA